MINSRWDNSKPIPNKLMQMNGQITDLYGNEVTNPSVQWENLEPIPNKVMNPDGSIGTFNFSVSGGSSGGSGISDVPLDNKSYVRKNQNWSELTELSEPVGGNIDGGTF